jgi:predicted permease
MATGQIAISILILIAAGLFVRTLRNLHSVELGFAVKNVWLLEFYPHLSGYNEQQSDRFFQDLVDELGRSPGVNSVSYANLYSFNGLSEQTSVESDGGTAGEAVEVETSYVGPGYFKTLGVPILRGREFNAQECAAAEKKVAIISQSLARQLFGQADPIGRVIRRPPYAQTVVGVSADVKYNSLRESSPGILFTPGIWGYTTVIARTQTPSATLPGMIRREVERIDKRVPIRRISTLQGQVERSLQTERLLASLLGIFGALVALLSGVGVFGVVSYAVNSRTQEFGIRMALGATPAEILWLVLRGALKRVRAALVLGVPLSLALSRFLAHMLYGLSPSDPWAIGAAVVLIAGAVLIASLAPAARAARLDAVEALRRG